MSDEPNNLLLEHMRRFDSRQARFEDALRDMSARLDRIERRLELSGRDEAPRGP